MEKVECSDFGILPNTYHEWQERLAFEASLLHDSFHDHSVATFSEKAYDAQKLQVTCFLVLCECFGSWMDSHSSRGPKFDLPGTNLEAEEGQGASLDDIPF